HHLPSPALSLCSPRLPRNDSAAGARRGGPAGSGARPASPGTSQRLEARRGPTSLGSRPSGSSWRAAGAGGCGGRTCLPRVEAACGRRGSWTGRIRGGRTYLPRIEAGRSDPVGACGWATPCPEGAHGGEIRDPVQARPPCSVVWVRLARGAEEEDGCGGEQGGRRHSRLRRPCPRRPKPPRGVPQALPIPPRRAAAGHPRVRLLCTNAFAVWSLCRRAASAWRDLVGPEHADGMWA
ncbi:unnamed protein product, partial [Urochloa humidicola]